LLVIEQSTRLWTVPLYRHCHDGEKALKIGYQTYPEVITIKCMAEDKEMTCIYEKYIREREEAPYSEADIEPSMTSSS
jgi:hypothetical protein